MSETRTPEERLHESKTRLRLVLATIVAPLIAQHGAEAVGRALALALAERRRALGA